MLFEGPVRTGIVLKIGFGFIEIRRVFRLELHGSSRAELGKFGLEIKRCWVFPDR